MDFEQTWKNQIDSQSDAEVKVKHLVKKSYNLVDQVVSRLKVERNITFWGAPLILAFSYFERGWLGLVISTAYISMLLMYYRYILRAIGESKIDHPVINYLQQCLEVLSKFKYHYVILCLLSFLLGYYLILDLEYVFTEISESYLLAVLFISPLFISYLTYYIFYHSKVKRISNVIDDIKNGGK